MKELSPTRSTLSPDADVVTVARPGRPSKHANIAGVSLNVAATRPAPRWDPRENSIPPARAIGRAEPDEGADVRRDARGRSSPKDLRERDKTARRTRSPLVPRASARRQCSEIRVPPTGRFFARAAIRARDRQHFFVAPIPASSPADVDIAATVRRLEPEARTRSASVAPIGLPARHSATRGIDRREERRSGDATPGTVTRSETTVVRLCGGMARTRLGEIPLRLVRLAAALIVRRPGTLPFPTRLRTPLARRPRTHTPPCAARTAPRVSRRIRRGVCRRRGTSSPDPSPSARASVSR